jgi:chromosome segregation ATPase
MVELIMFFGIGFLTAALSVLIVIPLIHNRAVRLTTRRLESAIPVSVAEIQADKDLLRADFAVSIRRLEMSVERLTNQDAGRLTELGKKSDAVNHLRFELSAVRDQLGATEQELTKERANVEDLGARIGELEQQVMVQANEIKVASDHAKDLDTRLIEQSQLVEKRDFTLKNMRREIEVACRAWAAERVERSHAKSPPRRNNAAPRSRVA